MMRRDRQLVNVSLTLVGLQDTAVAAHRPDTDGAAVSVRVGGALIWMHDRATAAKFADVWRGEDSNAMRLPREPVKVKGNEPGLREPTVMVEAAGSPTAFATLVRMPGHPTRIRVLLGRLAFDVRDLGAYRSTTAAFHRAADVAEEVFLDGGSDVRCACSGCRDRRPCLHLAGRLALPAWRTRTERPDNCPCLAWTASPTRRTGTMTAPDYPLLTLGGYETYQLAHIATFIADGLARHRLSHRGLPGRADRAEALRDLTLGRTALDAVHGSREPTHPELLPRPLDKATYESAQQRAGSGPRTADVVAMPSSGPPTWAVVGNVPGIGRVGALVNSADLAAGLRSHFLTRSIEELASWAVTDRAQEVPTLPEHVDLVRAIESLDPGVPAHRVVADALRGPDPYINAAVQRQFPNSAPGSVNVAASSETDSPQSSDDNGGPVRDQGTAIARPDEERAEHQEGEHHEQSGRQRVLPAQNEGGGRDQLDIPPTQGVAGQESDEHGTDRDRRCTDERTSAGGNAEAGDQRRGGAQRAGENVRQTPLPYVHHRGRGPGNRQGQGSRGGPRPLRRQQNRHPGQGRHGRDLGPAGSP